MIFLACRGSSPSHCQMIRGFSCYNNQGLKKGKVQNKRTWWRLILQWDRWMEKKRKPSHKSNRAHSPHPCFWFSDWASFSLKHVLHLLLVVWIFIWQVGICINPQTSETINQTNQKRPICSSSFKNKNNLGKQHMSKYYLSVGCIGAQETTLSFCFPPSSSAITSVQPYCAMGWDTCCYLKSGEEWAASQAEVAGK